MILAWLAYLAVAAFACAAMEGVAWASHRYLMHGPLWVLHRSHHEPVRVGAGGAGGPGSARGWQANDWFGIFFSLPSIALIAWGATGRPFAAAFGAGMAAYGAAYVVFHDAWAHGRFGPVGRPRSPWLDRLIAIHRAHHARIGRDGCSHFGFLWAPRRSRPAPPP